MFSVYSNEWLNENHDQNKLFKTIFNYLAKELEKE